MLIESPAFKAEGPIPIVYTCDGEDVSPPLLFRDIPAGAQSLVLIVDDPDAPGGTFDHWLAWNIPPKTTSLQQGFVAPIEGINGFHETRYRGPCPPAGKAHRYFFKVYALDIILTLPRGSTKGRVESEIQGHILGQAQLMGTYQRRR